MSISSSTSFDLTRTGIIRVAYQLIGVVPAGEDPSTAQLSLGTDLLNVELKALQNRGIILTKLDETTTTLVQGQAEYSTASDTLDIDSRTPYVTDTSGNDFPVKFISRAMYMRLTEKETESQPSQMYVERGTTISFFLYPTPDASWASITYPRVKLLTDMDSADINTGLRSKYLRGIVFWLAADLAFHHGLLEKQRFLKAEWEQAISEAVNDDTERGPIQIKPDYGYRFGRRGRR